MISDLRDLVARRAPHEGRHETALPAVCFHRADRPTPLRKGYTPSLFLAAVVQGAKLARVGDARWHYGAETYLVITGECEFDSAIVDASPERPYLSITVQLPPELIARTLLALEPGAGGDDCAPAYVSRLDATLIETLARLCRTLDDPDERRVVAPLALAELVFRLLRSDWAAALRRAAGRDDDRARITQAMTFMQGNLARRLSVAEVARHVAMSPSHFAHRFRDVARMSPIAYLKHLRLHEARALLCEAGLRPGEVAARVGYGSTAHFNRDFKQRFALPPAAYVRQFRAELSQDPASRSQGSLSP